MCYLFGDKTIVVLVHALEELLNVGLLAHELGKRELLVEIAVHRFEEVFNLGPGIVSYILYSEFHYCLLYFLRCFGTN